MNLVTRRRIEESKWPCIALGKIHSTEMIRKAKNWLRSNANGEFRVRAIQETEINSSNKRKYKTIATLYRFEQEDDLILFKLAWGEYE